MKKFYEVYFRFQERMQNNRLVGSIVSLAGLVAFVFAIKTSVLDANNIPSPSMEPTLMIGDFLFVNKMRYTLDLPYTNIHLIRISYPTRGDIVTFTPPQDSASYVNKTLVKRVVGVPGDELEVNDHEITISGVSYPTKPVANEQLLKTLSDGGTKDRERLYNEQIVDPKTGKVVVSHYMMKSRIRASDPLMSTPGRKWKIPANMYLMMGDNRDHSSDGRACDMVDTDHRKACEAFNNCMYYTYSGKRTEKECQAIYAEAEGEKWGLIHADRIHGKVYLSYLSVNWGRDTERPGHEAYERELNPIFNLGHTITGTFKGVYVRWERIFRRIY